VTRPLWLYWRNPGIDWRGRLRFLLGRDSDPKRCVPRGVDSATAGRALELIWESFAIPRGQRYCLRPDDELLTLYQSITPPGWPDCMQFETLHALLEQALGRSISVAELSGLRSIGDVVRLVASAQQMELTEGAASDGRQVRR
jgi:hypothetical protein